MQINYLSAGLHSAGVHAHFYMHTDHTVHASTACADSQLEAVRVCLLPAGDDVITSEQWGRPAYKHRKWCPDRRPGAAHTLIHPLNCTPVTSRLMLVYQLSSPPLTCRPTYAPKQNLHAYKSIFFWESIPCSEKKWWVIFAPSLLFIFPLQAGLVSPDCPEQLLIALEPEAASIYCRKLRLHQVIDLSLQPLTNGVDLEASQPFDSSFRQGREERKCLLYVWVCLVLYFVISTKPRCVPGNVVGLFHLGLWSLQKSNRVGPCLDLCVFLWKKKHWGWRSDFRYCLWFCLMTLQFCVCVWGGYA